MPDKNKILHLVPADCDWESALRIAGLAAALREHGFTSAITSPDHSRLWEFAEAAGVENIAYSLEPSYNPLRWLELSKLIKQSDAAIVHLHEPEAARMFSHANRFLPKLVAVSSRYNLRTQPTAVECGGGIDAVVCSSAFLADSFHRLGATQKVSVIFDGIPSPMAERAVEERDRLRIQLRDAYCPDKEKPLFVVNMAPLEEDSGQADILEAMAEIIAVLPQTHLVIMGEGALREELYRQIRIMALEKDVVIIEPDKAFVRILAAADVYVSASKNDVSGVMIQAAMMTGRATALVESGCHSELAEDGKTAIFAHGAGALPLRDAILELLENRTRREHIGRLAKARALKEFDMTETAKKTAEIYGKLTE